MYVTISQLESISSLNKTQPGKIYISSSFAKGECSLSKVSLEETLPCTSIKNHDFVRARKRWYRQYPSLDVIPWRRASGLTLSPDCILFYNVDVQNLKGPNMVNLLSWELTRIDPAKFRTILPLSSSNRRPSQWTCSEANSAFLLSALTQPRY